VLKVAHYPTDSVPPGSFQSIAALGNARLAMRSMAPNEPILPDQITGPGGKLTLSVALTEGMRAVSLRSSDIAGVAGFVLPGDHVDILLTRTVGSGDNQTTVTQSLAENVLVMAIDQSANDESTTPAVPRAVTVEVTPAQAQMIYLAQAVGTVTLTLRHVADQAPLMRHATTVADLGYQPPRPRPPLAGGPPPLGRGQMLVRVTRGIDGSDYAVSRY
jgi:pilus assembly protein CpaB